MRDQSRLTLAILKSWVRVWTQLCTQLIAITQLGWLAICVAWAIIWSCGSIVFGTEELLRNRLLWYSICLKFLSDSICSFKRLWYINLVAKYKLLHWWTTKTSYALLFGCDWTFKSWVKSLSSHIHHLHQVLIRLSKPIVFLEWRGPCLPYCLCRFILNIYLIDPLVSLTYMAVFPRILT